MSARTKQNIWWALERFGMPTVFCLVLWVGFRNDAAQARSDQREFNDHLIATTDKVATALAESTEVQRQLVSQQRDLERTIDRQTIAFEKLIDMIAKQQ